MAARSKRNPPPIIRSIRLQVMSGKKAVFNMKKAIRLTEYNSITSVRLKIRATYIFAFSLSSFLFLVKNRIMSLKISYSKCKDHVYLINCLSFVSCENQLTTFIKVLG